MPIARELHANFSHENPNEGDLATQLPALTHWEPERWTVAHDWQPIITRFLSSERARLLGRFVQDRLAAGATIYPPQPFQALALTPLERIKVVILGQDPYHGPGQAQGLAFSVAPGVTMPPSLRNIFKEIARDDAVRRLLTIKPPIPVNGCLASWAHQGVLLLNTCLTVEQGQPTSHAKQGWEGLTDEIIKAVGATQRPIVFVLWGTQAQTKRDLLVNSVANSSYWLVPTRHLVLTANHPSPLSALRPPQPFIGCGHFGQINAFLQAHRLQPIVW